MEQYQNQNKQMNYKAYNGNKQNEPVGRNQNLNPQK